ncbi:BolA family protein [Shinella zoogloeoides]|uniref:BolA family protein n=1 Tax=Shinella zoogloeoides TaxID=352475 RepID=UPI0028AD5522|nr:BolA family protein [Shinella zoogloeoides]
MSMKSSMTGKLEAAFSPERLEVVNESHLHAGHQPGFDGEGETHMRIRIVSSAFAGMSRVARHRAINEVVKAELDAGLHALAVEAAAPGEPTRW